jgi:hypothetical protein
MDEMIAFLRTRLDEDERRIQLTEGPGQPLAGVTAVRTIVEEWCQTMDRWIRLLALPYAWHTDFKEAWREEWRPRA